ncbi:hypothetical protein mRhiFer1_009553 [Rhinolophus ferrumequinum]|uniref:Uncharacterized protein n=1 Tax=Rhinolophus ferrumequinum TaxID=59479 RepID=A0A7J7ZRN5_RHIFE|nr:hypothetical protein mRhiFer1_009553 [Rhinolophus ferrumequinum]
MEHAALAGDRPHRAQDDGGARAMDMTSQKDSAQGIQREWDMTEAVYGDGTLQTHSPTKSLQRALWNDHKDLKPQAQSHHAWAHDCLAQVTSLNLVASVSNSSAAFPQGEPYLEGPHSPVW